MSDAPLPEDERERFLSFALDPETIPDAYARLALDPEAQKQLTERRQSQPTADLELAMFLDAVGDPELLSDEQVLAYLDDTLDPVERAIIESHLAIHPESRAEIQQAQAAREMVASLPPLDFAPLPSPVLMDTSGPLVLEEEKELALANRDRLPDRVAAWIRQVLEQGIVTPIISVQQGLERMHRMFALLPSHALRSSGPVLVSPRNTAIRSRLPRLRWAELPSAQEYTAVVARQDDDTERIVVWKQNVGQATEVVLPPESILEADQCYVWQVTATVQGQPRRSEFGWFLTLSETDLQEIQTHERDFETSALARIGIYEAYGLYEEALSEAQVLAQLNPGNSLVQALLEQLPSIDISPR